jgi:hypothetical protein
MGKWEDGKMGNWENGKMDGSASAFERENIERRKQLNAKQLNP